MRLWDVAGRRVTVALTGHTGQVFAVAFDSAGRTLASGAHDRRARLWRVS